MILIILLILIATFVVLAKNISALTPKDLLISRKVYSMRNDFLTKIMKLFTEIGKGKYVTIICTLLFFMDRENSMPKIAAISSLFSYPVGKLIKNRVKRVRPNLDALVKENDYSFPSYHALTAATLYGSVIVNYNNANTLLIFLTCSTFILFIGLSRVYLGVHYFSDVLGGWILGFIIVCITTHVFT